MTFRPGWVPAAPDCGFGIENLPYGAFRHAGAPARVGVAIGEFVLDLTPLLGPELFAAPTLNRFLATGRRTWASTRARIVELLTDERHRPAVEPNLIPRQAVTLNLPFEVADYVDFYSCEHHARNVGRMFRPDGPDLPANWKHLPAAYHGRAGTVVVSGTPIVRPSGQRPAQHGPVFGPEPRLDVEAELGLVVGAPSPLGSRVAAGDIREHVFGVVLLNDWSARAIQSWEYTPLGPFLGKSFATSIAPWVVPLDALDAAVLPAPPQNPPPLPYLTDAQFGLDVDFEINWNETVVARPSFRDMYWTSAQQLAHLTVNGAALRTGDLYASGTVSGPARGQRGSFLELSWNGSEEITLADGSVRMFLEDGDIVAIRATAPGPRGSRISLGEVTGTVLPAR